MSDVDTFLNRFNHNNGYKDESTTLKLGNYVTINDGTYNTKWIIAGFDMEYNRYASDCTFYNNGYGICLVPKTYVTSGQWNKSKTTSGGYYSSYMHNTVLPNIVSKLQNVLGSHIVNRNVLLSSSVNGSGYSNASTWTTSYATLLTYGQMSGTIGTYRNRHDDGEANYRLPVYHHETWNNVGYSYWFRNIYTSENANYMSPSNGLQSYSVTAGYKIRSLIYIR